MIDETRIRSTGGIAPFGYKWRSGTLVIDEKEAPIRELIYELFLKHRRKKTVANILNDLGYRTRNDSAFSDTTIGRLLRDTTAKGLREVHGQVVNVESIVDPEIWDLANKILGGPAPTKQTIQLFTGIAFCGCGGKMYVPSNSAKYICPACRRKIPSDDLEDIFRTELENLEDDEVNSIGDVWIELTSKDKRTIVEQICSRVAVERDTIRIEFHYSPHSPKAVADGQQIETANKTSEPQVVVDEGRAVVEPLLSEADAAKFLGVSKMTVLRKRNAGEIGFFRVGFRVLYSKEKHLLPFLQKREKAV